MSPLATDAIAAAQALLAKHYPSSPWLPTFQTGVQFLGVAADTALTAEGLPALAKAQPTIAAIVNAALPVLDGLLKALVPATK